MPLMPTGSTVPQHVPAEGRARLAARWFADLGGLLALIAILLFLPSLTTDFPEAKAYLAVVFLPAILLSIYFLTLWPAVIARRLRPLHQSRAQRNLVSWFRPLFLLAFLIPGLDHHFRWSDRDVETVPVWLAMLADSLILLCVLFGAWVMRINAYTGKMIRNDEGLSLITEGPYTLIRHPFYAASLILWLATPVALGSWVALPAFLLVTPFYVMHLRNEEAVLRRTIPGYPAYCKRTPFRLIPFIW